MVDDSANGGRIVITAMRPKPGCEQGLADLIVGHVPILAAEGLVTDRKPMVMTAADGTVIEVFEWKSAEAIASAHDNPRVQALWGQYAEVCDFVPLGELAEARDMFAEFAPLDGPA